MKLCSRLLMFSSNVFFSKNDDFEYLKLMLGKLRVTHDLGWWLVGKPMVDFLFAFLRYLLRFRSYEAKCVQFGCLACFHRGSTSFHSKFTWTGSSPILLRSFALTIQECDARTDRQTDGFAVAYTALRRAVKRSMLTEKMNKLRNTLLKAVAMFIVTSDCRL